MTFSGKFFFPSKVPEFLYVLFNLVVKHSPVFFLTGLRFVSEKNEDKIMGSESIAHEAQNTIQPPLFWFSKLALFATSGL